MSRKSGFTESGINRYQRTTSEFSTVVFQTAVTLGERDKMDGTPREVTHEHVRDAAETLAKKNRNHQSSFQIFCQSGEYIFTALVGVGGGHLEQQWGILTFGLSLVLGIAFFVMRSTRR